MQVGLDEIHLTNPYSIKAYGRQIKEEGVSQLRQTLRDVTARVDTVDVTLEMQVQRVGSFVERAFYYLTDLYGSHYDDHDRRYSDLRPVWSMNVMGQPVFGCPHPLHMFVLRDVERDESLAPELARLGFFELSKTGLSDNLARWRDFFLTSNAKDDDSSYIKQAADIIRWANLSQEERDMDKLLEKALATQEAEMDYARQEARREGRQQGPQEGRREGRQEGLQEGIVRGALESKLANARVALRMGLAHADIAEITGLDAATVDQLAQEVSS